MLRDSCINQQFHYCPKTMVVVVLVNHMEGGKFTTPLWVEGRQMSSHCFLKWFIRGLISCIEKIYISEIPPKAARQNVPFWWWFNLNESFAYSIYHLEVGKFIAFTLRFQAHEWSYYHRCSVDLDSRYIYCSKKSSLLKALASNESQGIPLDRWWC